MQHDAPTPADSALTEWLLRAFGLLAYGFGVANLFHAWWSDTSRWTVLLLLVFESYTLLLVLIARRASVRDASAMAMALTVYAAFYFALLDPRGNTRLIAESAGVALQLAGAACQFSAKLMLGRSFGLLPAQRGVVMAGPYRLVRHPIYLGYLIAHVGFVLVNFSWRNLAVFVLLYAVQVLRIQREEAVLAGSEAYRAYQQRVRWRLLPFVF